MMNISAKKVWYIWIIFAIAMCLMQASTIGILPSLMQDEAQVTDYGRLALDPLSNWSVTWWVAGEKPLLLWSYLGPLFAELGYQVGGPSGVGTRLMALIGGLMAAIMALGWLLERKVPTVIAGLLAFAFLLDPLFTLSQRMARSDSWVVAFCLASCWLLALSASKQARKRIVFVVISGMLAAAASFLWPSAVFIYPLICMEFFRSNNHQLDTENSPPKWWALMLYFILGGLFISILLIIPIRHQLGIILDNMSNMVSLNVNASKTPFERFSALFSYQPWSKLIKAFAKTLSPFLPLLALWAVLFRRVKATVFVSLFTLIIIFTTLVYEFRLLYLLPYFLLLFGDLFIHVDVKPLHPTIRKISRVFLFVAVIWSVGVSIFLRSAFAYHDGDLHKRSLLNEAATSTIGPGNHKVFLAFAYEFYFTGRSLGWQLYTPYIQFSYDADGNWIRKDDFLPKDKFIKLMSEMDYAIFPGNKIEDDIAQQLELSGLTYSSTIHVSDELTSNKNENSSGRMNEVIIWYLRGSPSYGPYRLYSRTKHQQTSSQTQVKEEKHQ